MKLNCRVRLTVLAVLMLGLLIAGCGGEDDDAQNARTSTSLSAKQTADMLLQRCLSATRKLPDAPSRQQAAAACRAAGADAPTGPGAPTSDDLAPPKDSSEPVPPDAKVVEASSIAMPSGGPEKVTRFPIPKGAKIVDLGPAFNASWQFGISSPDPATTLAFYKATLTKQGYTVKENVSPDNLPNVEFDIAFFGKTHGSVDANDIAGGTLVSINDRPLRGLAP